MVAAGNGLRQDNADFYYNGMILIKANPKGALLWIVEIMGHGSNRAARILDLFYGPQGPGKNRIKLLDTGFALVDLKICRDHSQPENCLQISLPAGIQKARPR